MEGFEEKIRMSDRIYVIGHVNPDTDTVAAAMGYAWLFSERDGSNTIASRRRHGLAKKSNYCQSSWDNWKGNQ